jgi:DNA-binding response OmpR family regulator
VPTVLVVDDDTDNRDMIAMILRSNGYDVLTAADAATAAGVIDATDIDLVLLDVRLPALSGTEFCRQLRERPRTADLPIVLVSADAGRVHIGEGLAAGADDYLVKPFSRAQVLGCLDALLAVPAGTPAKQVNPGMYAALAARPAAPGHLPTPAVRRVRSA